MRKITLLVAAMALLPQFAQALTCKENLSLWDISAIANGYEVGGLKYEIINPQEFEENRPSLRGVKLEKQGYLGYGEHVTCTYYYVSPPVVGKKYTLRFVLKR